MARHSNARTTLVVTGPDTVDTNIIVSLCQYKGHSVTIVPNDLGISLADRDLTIRGFWPIVEYLEERYPYPTWFPPTPVERASIRSLCAQLLIVPDEIMPALRQFCTPTCKFILGKEPTLIDLFAARVIRCSPNKQPPMFYALADRVDRYIDKIAAAQGLYDDEVA